MKLKYFSIIASFFQPVMASEIPNDVIITTENEELNYKQERAIGVSAALAWAAKIWGYKVVKAVAGAISYYGLRQSCKRWNDSNAVWDFVCDITPSGYFD